MHRGTVLGDANKRPVPQKQSCDALSSSLLPGLLHNSEVANTSPALPTKLQKLTATASVAQLVERWSRDPGSLV